MSTRMSRRTFLAALSICAAVRPAIADDQPAKADDGELWVTIGGSAKDKSKYKIVIYSSYVNDQGQNTTDALVMDTDGKGLSFEASDPGAAMKKDANGNPTGRITQVEKDGDSFRVKIKLPPGNYKVTVWEKKPGFSADNPDFETPPLVVRPGSEGKATKVVVDTAAGAAVAKPKDVVPKYKSEIGNDLLPGGDRGEISHDF